jgi:DNA-binding transcriptional ArsR family regulator
MRYESVAQILSELKRAYLGAPLAILTLCEHIALSYQPTYAHVRALEEEGVIETLRQGRKVVCRLAPAPETANWLASVGYTEARKRLKASRSWREVRDWATQALASEPQARAVFLLPGKDNLRLVLVSDAEVAAPPPAKLALERLSASEFIASLRDQSKAVSLLIEALPLAGGEWLYMRLLASQEKSRWEARPRIEGETAPETVSSPRPAPEAAAERPIRPARKLFDLPGDLVD